MIGPLFCPTIKRCQLLKMHWSVLELGRYGKNLIEAHNNKYRWRTVKTVQDVCELRAEDWTAAPRFEGENIGQRSFDELRIALARWNLKSGMTFDQDAPIDLDLNGALWLEPPEPRKFFTGVFFASPAECPRFDYAENNLVICRHCATHVANHR